MFGFNYSNQIVYHYMQTIGQTKLIHTVYLSFDIYSIFSKAKLKKFENEKKSISQFESSNVAVGIRRSRHSYESIQKNSSICSEFKLFHDDLKLCFHHKQYLNWNAPCCRFVCDDEVWMQRECLSILIYFGTLNLIRFIQK